MPPKNSGGAMDWKEILKDFVTSTYTWFACVWFCAGVLYVLKTIKTLALPTRADKIQYIFYGIGSSMLIGWVACELTLAMQLPTGLAGALGGLAGYIGANTISRELMTYFKKKMGIKDEGGNNADAS